MEVKDVLFMSKGDGENGYLHNSILTKKVASMTQPALQETVKSLLSDSVKPVVRVADLGCASGPNTFLVMSTVLSTVDNICRKLHFHQIPEIQFHLNDLPGNDFSTLFNGLSEFVERNRHVSVPFFVMGVPGSFHGRLFPTNTIDLIHSSYSVHWLSQVPEFAPPNKGKIYISKTSPPIVWEAYLAQFRDDFTRFLKSRSQEMVPNGRAILILHGRSNPDHAAINSSFALETLANAIALMVSQGLVEEENLDSFNVPYYTPSKEEIQDSIDMEGSFTTERLEMFEIEGQEIWSEGSKVKDVRKMADAVSKSIRGFTESMISHHFGEKIADALYGEFLKTAFIDGFTDEPIMTTSIIVVLRKK